MHNKVLVGLIEWFGENYGHENIFNVHDNSISCRLSHYAYLVITESKSEDEVNLFDYVANLMAEESTEPLRLCNQNFCAVDNKAIVDNVICNLERMLVSHCQELLPKNLLVYQAL